MRINPFDNVIVSEPRRIEKSVAGLNDKPLEELSRQVESLGQGKLPRAIKPGRAQFIMSPEPGYGKSHLIGRLFKKLRGHATLIYLRPFTNASTCWKSILLKMVQEMEFPDSAEAEFCDDAQPTQLEALVHGILMNVVVYGLEAGTVISRNKTATAEYLKKVSYKALRRKEKWVQWVDEKTPALASRMGRQLRRAGIKLNASPASWLKVLVKYAYFSSQSDLRQSCLDWLSGGSIDNDDAKRIGVRPSDRPEAELSMDLINEVCKNRVMDFCVLSGYYRPFVFCFDQTENYAIDRSLAKTFGWVINCLVDECYNHMTVITANQHPWTNTIKPLWEHAHLDRLRHPPLELEGLSKSQAKELITLRLSEWDLAETVAKKFSDTWLSEVFRAQQEWGVRHFLNQCSRHWQSVKPPAPAPKIQDFYRGYVQKIKTQPKRLCFDPDILYWLVSEVARELPQFAVEKFKSQKGYFVLVWKLKNRRIYFGFEAGSNWSRWNAINREAKSYFESAKKNKVVYFRTPELKPIPGRWKIAPEIAHAKQQYLHIIPLSKSDMAELYAAYDLYVDAAEGDIPFNREASLKFIRKKLMSFWSRILEASPSKWRNQGNASQTPAPAESNKALVGKIRDIVRREKFLSVKDLSARISPPVSEEELHRARACIAEIKVHVSPNMTVLQWRPNT
jgi:hypothetical protein